jgi:hypothetical protein
MGKGEEAMKRRSFIGSILAMIPAALMLPRIPKPPAPEGIPCEIITPPQIIAMPGAMGLEVGDPVYWDPEEGQLKKYPGSYPPEHRRVFGYVSSKNIELSNGSTKIDIRGTDRPTVVIGQPKYFDRVKKVVE